MSLGNIAKAKNYVKGKGKYYGRFNQGVVTINLPDVALSSKKDFDNIFNYIAETDINIGEIQLESQERIKGLGKDVVRKSYHGNKDIEFQILKRFGYN